MPGIRNVEETVKSKECATTEKAIPTTITTRQIGLATCKLFSTIYFDQRITASIEN